MIELKDLLEENETLVTFHLCNEYWSRNAITVKGNDDISGALEMTLHRILEAGGTEDDVKRIMGAENSNKNSKVLNTQRDYMAGIVSKDISRRFLLPPEIVQAHDEGIIHFHDIDYFGMNAMSNCSLINLEDMLQNGTCINKVMIEKPHRFITACTIATQIILGVTSLQYGGATITLTHLAPFVRESYNKYYEKYKSWGFSDEDCKRYAEADTKKEVADGVQTFNYQCNSMSNSNGQSPFLSVFMYLG